jgi:hypothetical protein
MRPEATHAAWRALLCESRAVAPAPPLRPAAAAEIGRGDAALSPAERWAWWLSRSHQPVGLESLLLLPLFEAADTALSTNLSCSQSTWTATLVATPVAAAAYSAAFMASGAVDANRSPAVGPRGWGRAEGGALTGQGAAAQRGPGVRASLPGDRLRVSLGLRCGELF